MTNVNAYIEELIRKIEADRDQEIAVVKSTILHEKVAPKNAEIDQKRDLALQELQTKLNTEVSALQEKFASERQAIIEASEKQKTENANALIVSETASVTYEYDTKIAELKKLIEG